MKNWVVVGVLLVTLFTAGCSGGHTASRVRLDDVATIEVQASSPVRRQKPPTPLQANNPGDQPAITSIVALINAAQEVGPEQLMPRPAPHTVQQWIDWVRYQSPVWVHYETDVVIHLKNGQTLTIRPAWDCTGTELGGGWQLTCTGTKGQVAFEPRPGKLGVRLFAPDLADWLAEGWQRGFPSSSAATPLN